MRTQGVVIPAYKPDERLVSLVSSLLAEDFTPVVIVDDGSGEKYKHLFSLSQEAGAVLLTHAVNRGKGVALKTAFNYFLLHHSGVGVITVDADGQHALSDVLAVADAMDEHKEALVLGTRTLGRDMPFKNRFGNTLTCFLFTLVSGLRVSDTQTGLRGLSPASLVPLLALEGDRYEYEMNMLLALRPLGIGIRQVNIQTIYEKGNRTSHFRPLKDGMRIYSLLLAPLFDSAAAAVTDFGLFALLAGVFGLKLLPAVAVSRVVSTLVNQLCNKTLAFRLHAGKFWPWPAYSLLVLLMAAGSYFAILLLSDKLGWNLYLAKLVSDIVLHTLSFFAQRDVVFARRKGHAAGRAAV